MRFEFDGFRLDSDTRELMRDGAPVPIEPQVFDLLHLLVENAHRVVTKDEIVQRVWFGRAISDWAVLGRIKAVRRALGDTGHKQQYVRTLRGQGFRFVGAAKLRSPDPAPAAASDRSDPPPGQGTTASGSAPCIAVLPFSVIGAPGDHAALADAIPRELIRSLSSLRWLRVIAHGSSFRFRGAMVEYSQIRQLLSADYCISGMIEVHGSRLSVDVDLADTRTGQLVWGRRHEAALDDVQQLRSEIAAEVINISEFALPVHEAATLDLDQAETLHAWQALHLGLMHMYRFNPRDTEIARAHFKTAARLEPGLARAHAGLSFTSFQRVFLGFSRDLGADRTAARASAETSIALEPRDPFANVVMGRSLWLVGDTEASKPWFDRAVRESPNYAFGRYAASWAMVFTGDYGAGARMTDQAIALSPLDPMRAGMLCNKMWIALAGQDYVDAVTWAERTARTPGAHAGHAMFAAMANLLAEQPDAADTWLRETRRRNPDFTRSKAMALVPYTHLEFRRLTEDAAIALNLPD